VTKNVLESKGGAAINKAIHDMKVCLFTFALNLSLQGVNSGCFIILTYIFNWTFRKIPSHIFERLMLHQRPRQPQTSHRCLSKLYLPSVDSLPRVDMHLPNSSRQQDSNLTRTVTREEGTSTPTNFRLSWGRLWPRLL
jgi:hypothetical protein